jgi:hypothetical protein
MVHMLSPLDILYPKGEMQANPPPQGLPWTHPTAQKASSAAAMCSRSATVYEPKLRKLSSV